RAWPPTGGRRPEWPGGAGVHGQARTSDTCWWSEHACGYGGSRFVASAGGKIMATSVHAPAVPGVLADPLRNRGVAFTPQERAALGLTGRLPSAVLSLEDQARRAYEQLWRQPTDLARNVFMEQ